MTVLPAYLLVVLVCYYDVCTHVQSSTGLCINVPAGEYKTLQIFCRFLTVFLVIISSSEDFFC